MVTSEIGLSVGMSAIVKSAGLNQEILSDRIDRPDSPITSTNSHDAW